MSEYTIRNAAFADVPGITRIYNHYVETTPITFDLEPRSLSNRETWFQQFSESGRHQLLVLETDNGILGYAGTTQFRVKPAYDPSVETTIYMDPDHHRAGMGRQLYTALFKRLAHEDIHRMYAGITIPNEASIRFHETFGFEHVGTFHEVGLKFGKYWDVSWHEKTLAPS
jgi:phosphinothricin acetyltransferase